LEPDDGPKRALQYALTLKHFRCAARADYLDPPWHWENGAANLAMLLWLVTGSTVWL